MTAQRPEAREHPAHHESRPVKTWLTDMDGVLVNRRGTDLHGDRMDTDIISGLEAGLRTVLVLTGSTSREQIEHFPYQPSQVVDSVADLIALVDPASTVGLVPDRV